MLYDSINDLISKLLPTLYGKEAMMVLLSNLDDLNNIKLGNRQYNRSPYNIGVICSDFKIVTDDYIKLPLDFKIGKHKFTRRGEVPDTTVKLNDLFYGDINVPMVGDTIILTNELYEYLINKDNKIEIPFNPRRIQYPISGVNIFNRLNRDEVYKIIRNIDYILRGNEESSYSTIYFLLDQDKKESNISLKSINLTVIISSVIKSYCVFLLEDEFNIHDGKELFSMILSQHRGKEIICNNSNLNRFLILTKEGTKKLDITIPRKVSIGVLLLDVMNDKDYSTANEILTDMSQNIIRLIS